jgi:hypothetical protein
VPHTHRITHWSARFLGTELGVSFATVARIWRKCGLQPHRIETFRFSTDPELEPKIRDIAGLYLDPPANAVVAEGFSCVLAGARQVRQLPGPAEAGPRPIPAGWRRALSAARSRRASWLPRSPGHPAAHPGTGAT